MFKKILGIIVGSLVLYLIIKSGWGLLNMQKCSSDLPENPTCEQIAENNASNCKYVILRWKKVNYNKELQQCKEWEQKQQK